MFRKVLIAAVAAIFLVGCVEWMPPQQQPPTTPETIPPTTTTSTVPPTTTPSTTTPPTTAVTTTTTPPSNGIWKPTADKPLTLAWILGDISRLTPSQVLNLQTKSLSGKALPHADVYDIDGEFATKAQVKFLQDNGKKVICYFDAGVYENYRTDAYKFPKSVIGNPDEGWNGSWWLDIRQIDILAPIMKARIDMCKEKGFDAIEPDEITGWSNNSGFPLTYNDQIRYNKKIAEMAHDVDMSIGLKGDIEQAVDLVDFFDWTLNEECYQYNECTSVWVNGRTVPGLQVFIAQNKAVWIAEYISVGNSAWCRDAASNGFNLAWYKLGLPTNGGRTVC